MQEKPLVSVVIPVHNMAKELKQALKSVQSQSYKNFEIIIVDDGSNDNTQEYVKSLKSKKIRYFFQQNKGPSAARNRGIKKARGSLIAFLDADDEWLQEHLKQSVALLQEQGIAMVFGRERLVNKGLNAEKFEHMRSRKKAFYDSLPKIPLGKQMHLLKESFFDCLIPGNLITPNTVVARKDVLNSVGGFDLKLRVGEDFDLWLRIAKNNNIGFVDAAQANYNLGEGHYDMGAFSLGKNVEFCNSVVYILKKNFSKYLLPKQKALFKTKLAKMLFSLGYSFFVFNQFEKAKQNYEKSLETKFNFPALKGLCLLFLIPHRILQWHNNRIRGQSR